MIPKMHLITLKDSIRTNITHVRVTRDTVEACDTFAAVILRGEVPGLSRNNFEQGDQVLIPAHIWKLIARKDYICTVDAVTKEVHVSHEKNPEVTTYKCEHSERFPDIDGIIPRDKDIESADHISLNAVFLATLAEVLHPDLPKKAWHVTLKGTGAKRAHKVYGQDHSIQYDAIIMPVMGDLSNRP